MISQKKSCYIILVDSQQNHTKSPSSLLKIHEKKQTNNRSDDIRPSLQGPGVEITRRTLEGAAIRRKVSHRAPIPANSSRSGENI